VFKIREQDRWVIMENEEDNKVGIHRAEWVKVKHFGMSEDGKVIKW
jgi:hypothetical protein